MTIREFVKQALTDVVAKAKTVFASKAEVPQIIITDNITEKIKQRVAAAPNSVLNYNDTLFYPDYIESGEELPTVYCSHVHDDGTFSQLVIDWNALRVTFSDDVLAKTHSPALTGAPTAPTAPAGTNTTQIATTAFVNTAIDNLPKPMQFKGSLGTGGTITSLPTASTSNIGWTYQVITAGTYAGQTADVGDVFISTGTEWTLIPSGDEPTGTVTSVGAGTGLSISGNPAINPTVNVASGYKLPTTAEWDEKEDVFWATYSTTSYADILAAHNAGKVVLCNISGTIAQLTSVDSTNNKVTFTAEHSNGVLSVDVNASGWSIPSSTSFEKTTNKVTTLSSSSTDTQYPSAKVVYDTAEELRESDAEIQESIEQSIDDGASVYQSAQKFLFRKTGGSSLVMDANNGLIKRIKGRTLVWNQLVQNGDFSDGTTGWNGTGSVANGIYTVTWPAQYSNNGIYQSNNQFQTIVGHTYYVRAWIQNTGEEARDFYLGQPYRTTEAVRKTYAAGEAAVISGLYTPLTASTTDATGNAFKLFATIGAGPTIKTTGIMVIDLTLLGWVPSTAEEFRALFPLPYYDYNAGELKNNAATDLESTGFNQMVSVPQNLVAGSFPAFDKNIYTRVFGGVQYYFRHDALDVVNWRHAYKAYDLEGNEITANLFPASTMGNPFYGSGRWIDSSNNTNNEFPITFNQDCYVYFGYSNGAVTAQTEIKNACINLSDPDRNGTYEPCWKATRHLGLNSIQAKEVGSDTIVTINGLDGVGDNVDLLKEGKYIEKACKRIDLGSLTWTYDAANTRMVSQIISDIMVFNRARTGVVACTKYACIADQRPVGEVPDKSVYLGTERTIFIKDTAYTDPATFKTAMAGVILDYPVATPKEYELVEPINTNYRVDKDGTEKFLPEQTASVILPPVECDMKYKNIGVEGYKLITDAMWNSKADKVLMEKTFPAFTAAASDQPKGWVYFMNVVPTDDNWAKPWRVHYKLSVSTSNANIQGEYDCIMGVSGNLALYANYNEFSSTSYYPIYNHLIVYYSTAAKYANRETNPVKIGARLQSAASATTVARVFKIQVIEAIGCTVSFTDSIETYESIYTDAKYGSYTQASAAQAGLQESGDLAYPNYYNYYYYNGFRLSNANAPLYRYKVVGFDEKMRVIPFNITNQTTDTIIEKTPCSLGFVVSNGMAWYNGTANIAAVNAAIATGSLYWNSSNITGNFLVAYNFNTVVGDSSNDTLHSNVYWCGTYDAATDKFYLDTTSPTSWYAVASNNAADATWKQSFQMGKYYWLIGHTVETNNYFGFFPYHPLYYFDGDALIPASAVALNSKADLAGSPTQDFAVKDLTVSHIKYNGQTFNLNPTQGGQLALTTDIPLAQAQPQVVEDTTNKVRFFNGTIIMDKDAASTITYDLHDFFDYYCRSLGINPDDSTRYGNLGLKCFALTDFLYNSKIIKEHIPASQQTAIYPYIRTLSAYSRDVAVNVLSVYNLTITYKASDNTTSHLYLEVNGDSSGMQVRITNS